MNESLANNGVAVQSKPRMSEAFRSVLLNPVYCVSSYLVYLLLRQIAVLGDFLGPLQYPLVLWAYVLIGYYLLKDRTFFQAPWIKVLVLLLPAALITLAVNYAVNPVTQIKSGILLAVSVLLVYPLGAHIARSSKPHRELAKVLLPAQIITGLQALTSVAMVAVGFTFMDKLAGASRHLGAQSFTYEAGNRVFIVFGMNVDSNHAALFGLVSMFVTTWALIYREKIFFTTRGKKRYRILYWINLVLLVIATAGCNSRGARLSLLITLAVIGLCLFVFYYRRSEYLQKKSKALLVVWVILIGGLGYTGVNATIDTLIEGEIAYYAQVFKLIHPDGSKKTSSDWKMVDDISMLRVNKGDSTKSARVYIWEETFDLWKGHRIVGIGPYNTVEYAKAEHLPSEQKMLERGYYVHNSYLDVLISYGALGFGIYVVFFLGCLVSYGKALKQRHPDWSDFFLGMTWLTIMSGVTFLTDSFLGLDYLFGILLIIMSYLIVRPSSEPMRIPVITLREAKLLSER